MVRARWSGQWFGQRRILRLMLLCVWPAWAGAAVPDVSGGASSVPAIAADRVLSLRNAAFRALRADDWHLAQSLALEWIRLDAEADLPWLLLAWTYAEQDDYRAVVASYNRAIRLNPEQRAEVWRGLGLAYTQLKRTDYAVQAYRRAAERNPLDARGWRELCEAQLRDGNPEQALDAADRALAREDDYAEAWACRGDALLQQNALEQAESAFRKAIDSKTGERYTDRSRFWLGLGQVYEKQGRTDEIAEVLEGMRLWNAEAANRFEHQFISSKEPPPARAADVAKEP